jgi:cyclopropane-fatty-acyl-phospholipid synthase
MTLDQGSYSGATAGAIRYHYDLSNTFYQLFLDPTLTYSCALWQTGDTLQTAQERKLDHIATESRATGQARVLDVGCGWGSMLRRLVEHHDVRHAVGLTLSSAQADALAAHTDSRIEVRLEGWADHSPTDTYGAIVSIGAFEHFAQPLLTRRERVAGYREFFKACRSWLPNRGRLAVQTIAKGNNVRLDRDTIAQQKFVMDRIFPESELPWMSEIVEASERRFELVGLRSDAVHYARTCLAWLANLRQRRQEAVALIGEERVADYERYLAAFAHQFEQRHLSLLRLIFEAR